MITVYYFAGVREMTGRTQENLQFSGKTVAQLRNALVEKYPDMQEGALQFAVNEEYALPEDVLAEGDAVALIPPVSGG